MRIILNMLAVRSGGGQQVASGLIEELSHRSMSDQVLAVVGHSTFLNAHCRQLGVPYVSLPFDYLNRSFRFGPNLRNITSDFKPDVIYAFTPTPKVSDVPVVLRSVYSNLYFPEVKFWNGLPVHQRVKKHAIDFFRRSGTFSADGLVFENQAMLRRAVEKFNFPIERAAYIAPSISSHLDYLERREMAAAGADVFKILLLTSWHKNKNLEILPLVAKRIKDAGHRCKFIISVLPDQARPLYRASVEMGLSESFEFIGPVAPDEVGEIINDSSALMLLSKLESFSSNLVEAWHFERPLFCADEPWSRSACGEAAFFVNRDSPSDIAKAILSIKSDETKYRKMVEAGKKALSGLNTPASKFDEQWAFLEEIASLGPR